MMHAKYQGKLGEHGNSREGEGKGEGERERGCGRMEDSYKSKDWNGYRRRWRMGTAATKQNHDPICA